jgi:flavin-binding protein dodecin
MHWQVNGHLRLSTNRSAVGIYQQPIPSDKRKEKDMSESTYKIIELVGSSADSWEEAAKNAVEEAGKTLKNLRIAEINKLDMRVEDGKVLTYRARVTVSFKYEGT